MIYFWCLLTAFLRLAESHILQMVSEFGLYNIQEILGLVEYGEGGEELGARSSRICLAHLGPHVVKRMLTFVID